jgi:hypothetical protein
LAPFHFGVSIIARAAEEVTRAMSFLPDVFLSSFALPLVEGGEVRVDRPLGEEEVAAVRAEIVTGSDIASHIDSVRRSWARGNWPTSLELELDQDDADVLAGVHNLLFLSHPESTRVTVRRRKLDRVVDFSRLCLERDLPASDAELIARHSLVRNVLNLRREDFELRFWVGRRKFVGKEPPVRLRRWPGIRRVHVDSRTVAWIDTIRPEHAAQLGLLGTLFCASPLTDLLNPNRGGLPFQWQRVAHLLLRPALARFVCNAYLRQGLVRVWPGLCKAFWRLVMPATEALVLYGGPKGERRALPLGEEDDDAQSADDSDPGDLDSGLFQAVEGGWPQSAVRPSARLASQMIHYVALLEAFQSGEGLQSLDADDATASPAVVLWAANRARLIVRAHAGSEGKLAARVWGLVEQGAAHHRDQVEELAQRLVHLFEAEK